MYKRCQTYHKEISQVAAHNGWITGMDLASHSGLLLSCAEDSYVR